MLVFRTPPHAQSTEGNLDEWPKAGACIWCGSTGPMSREHVLGTQFVRLWTYSKGTRMRAGRRPAGRRTKHPPFYIRNRVCTQCNKKWMSDLDSRTLALTRPSILHRTPMTFDADAAKTVGAWATKVSMLAILREHDHVRRIGSDEDAWQCHVPAAAFTEMYRHADREVIPNARVYVGVTEPLDALRPPWWIQPKTFPRADGGGKWVDMSHWRRWHGAIRRRRPGHRSVMPNAAPRHHPLRIALVIRFDPRTAGDDRRGAVLLFARGL